MRGVYVFMRGVYVFMSPKIKGPNRFCTLRAFLKGAQKRFFWLKPEGLGLS